MTPLNKTLIFFLFLIFSTNVVAQKNTIDTKSFNLLGISDYFISAETNGNAYVFTIYSIKDGPKDSKNVTFTLRPMTKESFIQNFFRYYDKFYDKIKPEENGIQVPSPKGLNYLAAMSDEKKSEDYRKLEEEATKLFYMFVAESIVYDDRGNEPIAGTICYVDSLLILRSDVNYKSQHRIIKRLWKVYKQDRKLVKESLKAGKLDEHLDSEAEISDTKLNEKTKGTGQESLSGEFQFSQLTARMNRRKFFKSKEKAFLTKRADDQQSKYEIVVEDLNKNTTNLKISRDSLKAYKDDLAKLDSIKHLESRRKNATKEILEAYKNDRQIFKAKGKAEKIYNLYNDINFGAGPVKEAPNILMSRLLDYDESLLSLNCQENEGEEWHIKVNNQRDALKTFFTQSLEKEKKALAITSDSANIQKNIYLFESILKIFESIPALSQHKVCENVNILINLNKQQEKFTSQINNPTTKTQVKSLLYPHLDTLTLGDTQISILTYSENKSDIITKKLDTLTQQLNQRVKIFHEKIDTLEKEKNVNIRRLAQQEDQLIFKSFKVDSIVIEINEGFIENIQMVGKVDEYSDKYGHIIIDSEGKAIPIPRTLKFENSSPIGFSRKLDFDAIKGKSLYTRGGERIQYETYLEDVLTLYIQEHEVGRRDYSPANQKVVLKNDDPIPGELCKGLKKEATYKLFEAKVFSDFVGLDETVPNGLIQTEISKRINLLTNRKPFQFISFGGLHNEWNVGGISYFEPSLTLSKIENNNKMLPLQSEDRFVSNQYTPIKYTSTLKLKQFENFSVGADANLILLDIPNIKSTFFLNFGFRYGRTGIQDSIRTAINGLVQVDPNAVLEYGVNTFDLSRQIMWNIYADERYGFSLSWEHHWFYLRDNRFEQVANNTFFDNQVTTDEKKDRQFNKFRFLMTLEQSSNNNGRLFFRYTYHWQQGFWRTGFHQAQVGYSFFLLGRPKND